MFKALSTASLRYLTQRSHSKLFSTSRSCKGIYEPDYLELMKSPIPIYSKVNIQIKGYDFPVLENFQKFIHTTAETMEIDVEDGWALPPQHLKVKKIIPASNVVDCEYDLKVYERHLQVIDIYSYDLNLLLEVLEAGLPEGVHLNAYEHSEEHQKARFVPDTQLKELEAELESIGGPRPTTYKKRK